MRNFLKKILILFFAMLLVLVVFGTGFYFGNSSKRCEVCQPQEINFSLFWEAFDKLKDKYVSPEKLNIQKIIYGAISGMVKSLDDPYTVFFNPDETKDFLVEVSGRFEGVGMEVGVKKGQLRVIAPLEGTPAQKAGLRPGDKIIKINDTFTIDLTTDEAVNLIRGPKNTEVALSILRDGWDKPKEFKIKRAVIEIPSLKWEIKDGDIAYVELYQFSQKASYDFAKTGVEILNSPAKKIILDLRNNPGGYLEISQDIAGWFLEKGKVVAIEDFGGKKERNEYKAKGNSSLLSYPLVILINEGSASASEILAGALRDNRAIKLVGQQSFGKGSVQELQDLTGGSSLKITVAKWLTPKGDLITEVGLKPDVKVEMTEQDYSQNKDPQLDKAIEIIKEMR